MALQNVCPDAPTQVLTTHSLQAPIEHKILCPPVPSGYVSVPLADLEQAARLGELLASEYAEEYAEDSPGVPPS
jgi:hypothetical protein